MPLFILIILFISAILGYKKIDELSSDPHKDKDFFPNIANNSKQLENSELPFTQLGGTINDASAVNRTSIYGIVKVTSEEDIKKALQFAGSYKLKVSIAGSRHSMGGQTFATNALILDMKGYKKMSVDKENKILTVQSGAIWHDIQIFLSPYHLSISAMQSIDVPTVGGTISVNAHGMDHRVGGIASTIRSIRLMLADGSIARLSKSENTELFNSVIGGYGFLGIILDVEIALTDNLFYTEQQNIIKTEKFFDEYDKIIENKNIHMFYARLSTAPSSFLKELVSYTFEVTKTPLETPKHLTSESAVRFRRFILNLGRKNIIGREIKWWSEKNLQPYFQATAASRNQIMHRSYGYLKNNINNNTDVLQEYFLPKKSLLQFVKEMGLVLNKHKVITRNVEFRIIYKANILLDYAQGNWFAVVLYLNFNSDEVEKIMLVHHELITISQDLGGSFYLPYLLSASKEQIEKSYPGFKRLLELKKKYDPEELFTNKFYEKYK